MGGPCHIHNASSLSGSTSILLRRSRQNLRRKSTPPHPVPPCVLISGLTYLVRSVFASRITMSKPYYYRKGGFWIWRRYAVNTVPRLPNYTAQTHVSIRIPWPKRTAVTKPDRECRPYPHRAASSLCQQQAHTTPLRTLFSK